MTAAEEAPRPPEEGEPGEYRSWAYMLLRENDGGGGPLAAIGWALLSIATDLAALRRDLHRKR
ncbi:hypothetical protein [Streptomyces sp. URMC 129]|uniref:hypothetical protein n=1 Tax=Streptomyces sp. URMC 129 TaxID=3423407 RepID=UPI003F1A3CCB